MPSELLFAYKATYWTAMNLAIWAGHAWMQVARMSAEVGQPYA